MRDPKDSVGHQEHRTKRMLGNEERDVEKVQRSKRENNCRGSMVVVGRGADSHAGVGQQNKRHHRGHWTGNNYTDV